MKFLLTIIILLIFYSIISSELSHCPHYATEYGWMEYDIYKDIEFNADLFDFSPRFIAAIIHAESRGNKKIRGRKGEIGLMQPLPIHFSGDSEKLQEPMINIMIGCSYLFECRKKAKGDLKETLRMYNQGKMGKRKNYKNWDYVYNILNNYRKYD